MEEFFSCVTIQRMSGGTVMKRLWTVFVLAAVIAGLVSGCAEPQIMADTEGNYILALIPAPKYLPREREMM